MENGIEESGFVDFVNFELNGNYKLMTENYNEQFIVNQPQSNEINNLHSIGTNCENNINIDPNLDAR